ncbi:major strawberry allergen Fra a 1.06-like [Salvia miltiorrhiza]|uniref:major strawberry allergen Fra a 1.06-like n=1 Tax=Salvia miltiorrhiza TaxID=226208 RepID=UPI0025ACB7B7|nr:major strawberry allergen Fra a 1.06-like [Salvia miltiorrhiza]
MGVIVEEQESRCSIPPTRLFKAYRDSQNLFPKVLPSVFKSIEVKEGNGGAGSILLITYYDEGDKVMTVKHKIEEVDETNHVYKFSVIEGDDLGEDFESSSTAIKIEAAANGGSVYKSVSTYHTKGDNHNVIREKINKATEAAKAFLQAIEAHLHSNPNEYK